MLALWFRVFRPGLQRTRIGQSDGEIIGEAGLLVAGRGSVFSWPGTLPEAASRLGGMGVHRR